MGQHNSNFELASEARRAAERCEFPSTEEAAFPPFVLRAAWQKVAVGAVATAAAAAAAAAAVIVFVREGLCTYEE